MAWQQKNRIYTERHTERYFLKLKLHLLLGVRYFGKIIKTELICQNFMRKLSRNSKERRRPILDLPVLLMGVWIINFLTDHWQFNERNSVLQFVICELIVCVLHGSVYAARGAAQGPSFVDETFVKLWFFNTVRFNSLSPGANGKSSVQENHQTQSLIKYVGNKKRNGKGGLEHQLKIRRLPIIG